MSGCYIFIYIFLIIHVVICSAVALKVSYYTCIILISLGGKRLEAFVASNPNQSSTFSTSDVVVCSCIA